MSKIVGIDLGTSTSEIAVLEDGKPVIISDRNGEKIIPSVVRITEDNEIIVGKDAKDQLLVKPQETIMEVKRLMGSGQRVTIGNREYAPEQVSSYILEYLKKNAEEYLGETVDQAVITVPAYFTDEQRKATVEAGKLAGLKVERIINEPTAAALAYGIEHMEENQHVLVYDLGGGTLDVTVLEMFSGVLEVKASSGNNRLGGKDFDQRVMDILLEELSRQGVDVEGNLHALARIKSLAEACKVALSMQDEYSIALPFIAEKEGQPVALEMSITRQQFEDWIRDLIESTKEPIRIALKDAGITPEELDIVLMVGGSTRIPLVKRFLQDELRQEPQSLVDPDLAVVQGAAVQGGIIAGGLSAENDILITDVCPYTLGTDVMSYFGGMPITDIYDVIIPRNTTIPVVKEKIYGTVTDNQSDVEIKVYQGDHKRASANHLLGNFMLGNIPPAPAFQEKVKVCFAYDVNGILQVEASIVSTGEKAGIAIETIGVKMEEEFDLSKWKEGSGARKYRALIRRAERMLADEDYTAVHGELDGLVRNLKKAIIAGAGEEELDAAEDELIDFLYEMEEEE